MAAQRADDLLAKGDAEEQSVWKAIRRAIEELWWSKPAEGERVNPLMRRRTTWYSSETLACADPNNLEGPSRRAIRRSTPTTMFPRLSRSLLSQSRHLQNAMILRR